MKKYLLPFVVLLILLALYLRQGFRDKSAPPEAPAEKCLVCHQNVPDVSRSHPIEAFGCAKCHLGNSHSLDENTAHRGMVKNPAHLAVAAKTCGQADCHPQQVRDVQHSLMATNSGIYRVLLYQWGEAPSPDDTTVGIAELRQIPSTGSLAVEHFRKFCATCHLWKSLGDLPGEIGTRGGGCVDCHTLPAEGHSRLTTQIPLAQCVKCHNRSARAGLSYQGIFESAWYGTPYERGGASSDTLSGNRFFYRLPPDVHHEAGMVCIDCHNSIDAMGTGQRLPHMEQQITVTCESCHRPKFALADTLNRRLATLNPFLQADSGTWVAQAGSTAQLVNVLRRNGEAVLTRKLDGKTLPVPRMREAAYHRLPGHERLSCQACHAAWTPQCYGCHEIYRRDEKQLDKISGKETPGAWSERRSFLRFERPTLGIGPGGQRVEPFAPGCQVFLTAYRKNGMLDTTFTALAMGAFDPHTTRKTAPACEACHGSPKVLGLGEGVLAFPAPDSLQMHYVYDAARSGLGIPAPLTAFVSPGGEALQTTSRHGARPFSQSELQRILQVNLCLPCHDAYEDVIYRDFHKSWQRFWQQRSLECWKELGQENTSGL